MGSCFIDTERVAAQGLYRSGIEALLEGRLDEAESSLVTALGHLGRSPRDVRADRALVEDGLGLCLMYTEDFAGALQHAQAAVRLYRELMPPENSRRAHAELQLADVLRRLGRPAESVDLYRGYIAAMTAIGDTRGMATGQNKLGLSLDDLGQPQDAIVHYENALRILNQGAGDQAGQVVPVMTNLATALGAMGQHAEAYRLHTEARTRMAAAFGETSPYVATIDHNRASSLERLGRLEEAAALYRASLAVYDLSSGYRARAAATRSWLSIVLAQLGDYAEGESECRRAHQDLVGFYGETHPAVATSWNHRGWLAQYGNRDTEALEAYERFTAILRASLPEGHPDIAVGVNNVGTAYARLGRQAEALAAYREGVRLELAARGETWPRLSVGYNNVGTALFAMGDRESALLFLQKALAHRLASSGDRHPHVAQLWMSIAGVHLVAGDTPSWIAAIEHAVEASRRGEAPWDGTAAALRSDPGTLVRLSYLAWARAADGRQDTVTRLRLAVNIFDTALELMKRLRAGVSGSSREIHERQQTDMFVWALKLRSELAALDPTSNPRGAVANAELVSAWSFLEQIAAHRAGGLLDAPPDLVASLKALEARGAALRQSEQSPQTIREAQQIEDEAERVLGRLRREAPRYAALNHPRPATAEDVQAILEPNEVALTFVKGRYGAFAVAVSKDSCVLVDLGDPVSVESAIRSARVELTSAAARTRGAAMRRAASRASRSARMRSTRRSATRGASAAAAETTTRSAGDVDPLRELDRLLLGSLEPFLRGKRLIIVPGSSFEGVAFGALRTPGGRWRIDEHEIVYAPSLAVFTLLRTLGRDHESRGGARTFLALGDPAYQGRPDPSASRSIQRYGAERGQWGALPASGAEVRAIAALFPADSRLVLTGPAATEARLTAESWTRVPYLHFACHGALEEGPGREPALVFSLSGNQAPADGFLTLSEVAAERIEAELVVLSACNSGRSGSQRPPTGISSLSRAFLLAGAENVVVSLWPVSDEATARLMVEFYKRMRREGMGPPAALRAASIALRDRLGLSAPALWAPFIVLGSV